MILKLQALVLNLKIIQLLNTYYYKDIQYTPLRIPYFRIYNFTIKFLLKIRTKYLFSIQTLHELLLTWLRLNILLYAVKPHFVKKNE